MTASTISAIGALIGLCGTVYGTLYVFAKRKGWIDFLREQSSLVTDLRKEKQRTLDFRERAETAESYLNTLRPLVEELRKEIEGIKQRSASETASHSKIVDTMVDLIAYAIHLEECLAKAGITRDRVMPQVPEVMRLRFNMPEAL